MSLNSVKQELLKIAPDLQIIEYKTSTASVEEAALAHKVEPGKIVKTLALMLEKPILLMTSGNVKIDNKKYKDFFKKKAKMLSADDTLRYTSHPIGGVCPFGLPNKIDIYADVSLNAYDLVIPAAGSEKSSVKIMRERLLKITRATLVDVTKNK